MDSRLREIIFVILFKNTSNVLLPQGEMRHMKEMKSLLLICYPASRDGSRTRVGRTSPCSFMWGWGGGGDHGHCRSSPNPSLPARTNNALGVAFKKMRNKPCIKMTFVSYFESLMIKTVKWLDGHMHNINYRVRGWSHVH
jgi:hypothetical protein